jgi:hypothetical protein
MGGKVDFMVSAGRCLENNIGCEKTLLMPVVLSEKSPANMSSQSRQHDKG